MSAETPPIMAYCRACGKALLPEQQRYAQGTIYCEEHVPAPAPNPDPRAQSNPWTQQPPPRPSDSVIAGGSPGLAFVLGLIPLGVGAIYNGQYGKGLIHALVFGLLVSVAHSGGGDFGALLGMLPATWVFYMAFEAYHTAKRRQAGLPVDEFSSLFPLHGRAAGFPVAPVVLIVLGVVFLLNNLDILRLYHLARFWPIGLIALGVFMLYARISESQNTVNTTQEASHEQR